MLHGALTGLLTHDQAHNASHNAHASFIASDRQSNVHPTPTQYKQTMRCTVCVAIFVLIAFVLWRTYHPQISKNVDNSLENVQKRANCESRSILSTF